MLDLMARISVLCNDSDVLQKDGVWSVRGDPTEAALYPFASKLGFARHGEEDTHPRIDLIPFESDHKFMATLHRT